MTLLRHPQCHQGRGENSLPNTTKIRRAVYVSVCFYFFVSVLTERLTDTFCFLYVPRGKVRPEFDGRLGAFPLVRPLLLLHSRSSHSATHQGKCTVVCNYAFIHSCWIFCLIMPVLCMSVVSAARFSSPSAPTKASAGRRSRWSSAMASQGTTVRHRAKLSTYPSLLALLGGDNEVLGETFAVAF